MATYTVVFLSLFALIPLAASQCSVEKAKPGLRRAIYDFATELTTRVAIDSENHFVMSPLSLWTLLAAVSEGADSETLVQLKRALRLHPRKCFNSKYYEILRGVVESQGETILERGGAVVIDEGFAVKKAFKSRIDAAGVCKVLTTQFAAAEDAASAINSYVSRATHGAVEEITSPEDLDGKSLLLLDTIYFKGKWTVPFSTADTEVSTFYDEFGGAAGDVNLMFITGDFNVAQIDKIQAKVLELPYAGGKYSMLVFLPYTDVPLVQVIEALNLINLQSIFHLYEKKPARTVMVQLPRFKIESNLDFLVELLQDMGLTQMFDEQASFPLISDQALYVSTLLQKANIEVTEEGTVASAVSEAGFSSRLMPEQFVAQKPFLYMIVDKVNEVVLFTGAYSKPSVY
ncbi:serine protease inhibitor 77Ba-like [Plutella xylostella]|uniref:serine protease inhibitor 77Ba-like n=1 Tax=Plutella xylostella TaxID=51655 RepID=UPI0020327252|nr:serine protease inhibitor 77Ba-like [Plutella xylostella]